MNFTESQMIHWKMKESEEFLTVQIHGRNSSTSSISKTTTTVCKTNKWSVTSQNEGLTALYKSMFRQVTCRNEMANFISLNFFSYIHNSTSWYIIKYSKVASFTIVYMYTTYEQKYVWCLHIFKLFLMHTIASMLITLTLFKEHIYSQTDQGLLQVLQGKKRQIIKVWHTSIDSFQWKYTYTYTHTHIQN
jgi:hypothetical protein